MKQCFLFTILLFTSFVCRAQHIQLSKEQTEAIEYLDSCKHLQQSIYWINIKPRLFIENIRKNISEPLHIYAGSNTNFCSYAAVTYSLVNTYPSLYAHLLVELYVTGKTTLRKTTFNPSDRVKKAAGTLRFTGELDINQADQLWYMTLADRFKGYVNIFNLRYKPGAEDRFWPSTNFSKFNRMLRKLCNYETRAAGSDLIRPSFKNIVEFLNDKLKNSHQVFLYVNNVILHKRNHNRIFYRIPTHYIVLFGISENDGIVTFQYWDYGYKTQKQMSLREFKDIVFGVTWCKKQDAK